MILATICESIGSIYIYSMSSPHLRPIGQDPSVQLPLLGLERLPVGQHRVVVDHGRVQKANVIAAPADLE